MKTAAGKRSDMRNDQLTMTKGLVIAIQRVENISKRIESNSKLLNDTCWSQYISGSILIKSNFVFKCVTTTTSRSHSCFDVNATPLRKDRMSQQPISGECCSNAALPCPTKQDDAGFALHLAVKVVKGILFNMYCLKYL